MTGEEFRSLYRLGERLTNPPVVTHRATDLSGAPVLVHFLLEGTEGGGKSYLDRVAGLEAPTSGLIREMVEVEGRSVVVTEILEEFSTFQEWLDEAESSGVAQEETPSEQTEKREPGAYTQLFKVPEAGSQVSSPESPGTGPPPVTPEPPVTSQPEPPEDEGPGEAPGSYTMLFGGDGGSEDQESAPASATQGVPTPGAPEPATPAAPVFPTPGPEEPGDPAREDVSSEGTLPRAEAVDEPPPAEISGQGPGPGEGKGGDGKPGAYTQIFGRPAPGSGDPSAQRPPGGHGAAPPPPPQPGPPVQPPTPGGSPPDWQRWKDTPGAAGRHIPSDDYLQRLGGSSAPGVGSTRSDSTPPGGRGQGPSPSSDLLGGPDVPAGPGHYTMVREGFSADPTPPPMTQPSTGAASRADVGSEPAAMPSRRSSLLTILGLVAVFLTIVALVVVFAIFG